MSNVPTVPPLRARLKQAWSTLRGQREAEYPVVDQNRLISDWAISGLQNPDDLLRWSLDRIRTRARSAERQSPIARHFLRLAAQNVVGPNGIACQPQVRDSKGNLAREINRTIRDAWLDWSRSVTIDGKLDLTTYSRIQFKGVVRDGECVNRYWRSYRDNPYGFALEGIDPSLLDETYNIGRGTGQNEVRLGVEVNTFGRPTAYHVWDKPERALAGDPLRKRMRIPADQILHLYDPDLMNQTRGVSWLVTSMLPVRHLDKFREASIIKERIQASKMGFIERKNDELGASLASEKKADEISIEAAPGQFLKLPDGYTISEWGGDGPGTQFAEFVKDAMRFIGLSYGLSYPSISGDLSDVNYSSYKGGMLPERDMWKMLQYWWICMFQINVYREWLASALISGVASGGEYGLVLPKADSKVYSQAKWTPRGYPSLEPLKETTAAVMGIQTGLNSRRRYLAEQGIDLEDVLEELSEEQDLAAEYDVDISGPAPGTSKSAQDQIAADQAQQEADAAAKKKAKAGTNGHSSDAVFDRRW